VNKLKRVALSLPHFKILINVIKSSIYKIKQGKLAIFTGLFLLISHFLTAQNLTGKVSSETGETLVGVSIKIDGTDKGVITDIDGNFSIDLIEGKTNSLVFFLRRFRTTNYQL
jgi:hypothetical protein